MVFIPFRISIRISISKGFSVFGKNRSVFRFRVGFSAVRRKAPACVAGQVFVGRSLGRDADDRTRRRVSDARTSRRLFGVRLPGHGPRAATGAKDVRRGRVARLFGGEGFRRGFGSAPGTAPCPARAPGLPNSAPDDAGTGGGRRLFGFARRGASVRVLRAPRPGRVRRRRPARASAPAAVLLIAAAYFLIPGLVGPEARPHEQKHRLRGQVQLRRGAPRSVQRENSPHQIRKLRVAQQRKRGPLLRVHDETVALFRIFPHDRLHGKNLPKIRMP